ncbi:MAG: type II toxin-antitoxin system VapC family toxin [Rhizomicrobium sp.]
MILDSSAIVAILETEEEAADFLLRIERDSAPRISSVNFMETAIVIDSRRSPEASDELDDFLRKAGVAIVPADETHARIARETYRKFGKASGHKAKLNFGDCFAYALAKATGEPLLYKGRDFGHTDVASALK